jgi:S1-C subfamily serine protease
MLASFVTSIATGIVTATLMEQAPPVVSQTINRVVERTIEQVVQAPEKSQTATTYVTKETIVVKEDDQLVNAVEKNSPSLARFISSAETNSENPWVITVGAIVDKSGLIAVYKPVLNMNASYSVRLSDGKIYSANLVHEPVTGNIALYKIDTKGQSISPVSLGGNNSAKLGQTVVLLGGKDQDIISEGIVSSIVTGNDTVTSSSTINSLIVTDLSVSFSGKSNFQGVLMNLSGEIIALKGEGYEGSVLIPSNQILQSMQVYTNSTKSVSQ